MNHDAKRYKWLRDKEYSAKVWEDLSHREGDSFDAAVDESMAASSKTEGYPGIAHDFETMRMERDALLARVAELEAFIDKQRQAFEVSSSDMERKLREERNTMAVLLERALEQSARVHPDFAEAIRAALKVTK